MSHLAGINTDQPDQWCSSVRSETLDGLVTIKRIGQGTFGKVDLVRNAQGKELVVKRQTLIEDENHLRDEAIVEVDFLMRLGGCPQILPIEGICADWTLDLKMLLPKMDGDLSWYIRNTSQEVRAENYEYFLGEMALALDAVAQAGLVHADVKPGNILVACGAQGLTNPRPKFYLADFGISFNNRLFEAVKWDLYSALWRPPEYFLRDFPRAGVPLGVSDIWALGVVAYEYLENKRLIESPVYKWFNDSNTIFDENAKDIDHPTEYEFVKNLLTGKSYSFSVSDKPNRVLIRKMLNFNPYRRITPQGLLTELGLQRVELPQMILAPSSIPVSEGFTDEFVFDIIRGLNLPLNQLYALRDIIQDNWKRIGGQNSEDFQYILFISAAYFYVHNSALVFDGFENWKVGLYLARLQYVVLNPALEDDPTFYLRYNRTERAKQLMTAITDGQAGYISKILSEGFDNVDYYDGRTLLTKAALLGDLGTVKALLALGAKTDTQNQAMSALSMAAQNGHLEIVRELLAAGADVHDSKEYPLKAAIYNNHTEIVRELLAAGADVSAYNEAPLKLAKTLKNPKILAALGL